MDNMFKKTVSTVKDKIDGVVPDKEDFKNIIDKSGELFDKAVDATKDAASEVGTAIENKTTEIKDAVKGKENKDDSADDHYVKRKKDMIFQ